MAVLRTREFSPWGLSIVLTAPATIPTEDIIPMAAIPTERCKLAVMRMVLIDGVLEMCTELIWIRLGKCLQSIGKRRLPALCLTPLVTAQIQGSVQTCVVDGLQLVQIEPIANSWSEFRSGYPPQGQMEFPDHGMMYPQDQAYAQGYYDHYGNPMGMVDLNPQGDGSPGEGSTTSGYSTPNQRRVIREIIV